MRAVTRYYETKRQQYLDSLPACKELVEKKQLEKKLACRRRRLVTKFDRICEENASIAASSTNTCKSVLDELPDTRNAENEASCSVKEPVAEFRSTANKCTHRRPSCTSLCNTLYCGAPGLQ
ncbi:hypothetical protein P5673_007736 [Acropora cervicornis]|uniref:Uncharacterized protein n=1 Tax=Acropora cervicornis TaxID=6130 RepID=A0AAD9QUZ2_ACRCE|nr:hypothetical protein P5673_007736 [Acropora cervicornis]